MILHRPALFLLSLVITVLLMALTLGVAAGSSHVNTGEYIDVEPDGYWDAEVAAGGHQQWNFDLPAQRDHNLVIKIEDPAGASLGVSIDGQDLGTVSVAGHFTVSLEAGSHAVTINNLGGVLVQYEFYMGIFPEVGFTTLQVVKILVPGSDPGLFDLQVNSITQKENASDGDATGLVPVNPGSNTVGETAGTGTSLSNYTTTIECRDRTGTFILASRSDAGPLDVPLFENEVTCIITNTRITSVGGVTSFSSDSGSSGSIALFAGGVAAVVAIAAGGWYTRRRWLGGRS